jgi:hypothetical protein
MKLILQARLQPRVLFASAALCSQLKFGFLFCCQFVQGSFATRFIIGLLLTL